MQGEPFHSMFSQLERNATLIYVLQMSVLGYMRPWNSRQTSVNMENTQNLIKDTSRQYDMSMNFTFVGNLWTTVLVLQYCSQRWQILVVNKCFDMVFSRQKVEASKRTTLMIFNTLSQCWLLIIGWSETKEHLKCLICEILISQLAFLFLFLFLS